MRKILVVAPSWVGDTVLAQPLFMRLQAAVPGTEIDVLAPPWTAALLQRMPEVREVIENPFRHGELKVFARRRLGRALRARSYDAAIVLPNSLKSALPPFFASIPVRTGFRGEMRGGVLNDVRTLDEKRMPMLAERFAALAQAPGTPLARPLPRPHLRIDQANRARLLERLALDTTRPVVAFCPGAEYGAAKRWPAEHYAALADRLIAAGASVWLIGSPNDAPIGTSIAERVARGSVANLCGRTSLGDAVDLLSAAGLVISNDSGLMHVAAGLDRPLIALYGSSSPAYTPPLAPEARVLSLALDCSPCFERECPLGHLRCLWDLTPERVWTEIRELAGRNLPLNLAGTGC
ncbi:MAG: lipopolysaccharide heptosyltransferase II [Betaproteobacteria bacterium]|nr:MAG: lipopolysaccharide heptosyltransferase II [Betaproteobacteria bacterium]